MFPFILLIAPVTANNAPEQVAKGKAEKAVQVLSERRKGHGLKIAQEAQICRVSGANFVLGEFETL